MENSPLKVLVREDSKKMLGVLIAIGIIFQIVFYKEKILVVLWAVVSFFLTFIIPGFILGYLWSEKLDFLERFIIGTMLGLITVGIVAYNLSVWLEINIKIISLIAPMITTAAFGLIVYFTDKKNKQKHGFIETN